MRLKKDMVYLIKDAYGSIVKAQYMGRQEGFSCCVCDKGNNAYTFNIWHGKGSYETWGYGKEHFPEILEEIGEIEFVDDSFPLDKFVN